LHDAPVSVAKKHADQNIKKGGKGQYRFRKRQGASIETWRGNTLSLTRALKSKEGVSGEKPKEKEGKT